MDRSIDDGLFGKIVFVSAILVLFSVGVAGAVTPVTGCSNLSTAGVYVLTTDIIDSGAAKCIEITSSNVVFDGTGFTIDGVDSSGTYGMYVYNASMALTNVTVKNLKVTDWSHGIYYRNAQNGNIANNTASSNNYKGIGLGSSSSNNITGNAASNNYGGIYLTSSSNYNVIKDNTASGNRYGIYLESSSNNNIYNNYFNNVNNFDGFSSTNTWNTTKTPGTNIIGGPYLGGNYWAEPDGYGHSDTCTNADGDGICDSDYTLASGNVDYLPLTFTVAPQTFNITHNLNPGWNLISIPLEQNNWTLTSVLASIEGNYSVVYALNGTGRSPRQRVTRWSRWG